MSTTVRPIRVSMVEHVRTVSMVTDVFVRWDLVATTVKQVSKNQFKYS